MEASSVLSATPQSESATGTPLQGVEVPPDGVARDVELTAAVPVADPPAPVEPDPVVTDIPEPIPAKVFLVDGQIHLLADRAELVGKLEPAQGDPAPWLVLTRQNGSPITVRETAITSYE